VDKWLKWGHFLALTFTGMLTTHTFTIGIGNLRMLLTRPEKPLYAGLDWWALGRVGARKGLRSRCDIGRDHT